MSLTADPRENDLYFDYNATTPVANPVRMAVALAMERDWGNPGSAHGMGERAREALHVARAEVAALLGARPEEIVFTSGGTESNNTVLLGIVPGLADRGRHVVTTAIEHPSVLNPAIRLMELGYDVTFVNPDRTGVVQADSVARAMRPGTVLVSVMLANNETGAIQPVGEIARIARERGATVHTDAAQAVGKIPVNVAELGVDYLAVAGHKLYAPKGIGCLYIRRGAPFAPIFWGGGQEMGRRPGTEPVPLAVGLGAACRLVRDGLDEEGKRLERLREIMFSGLSGLGVPVVRHGPVGGTIPNTLSVGFPGLVGSEILSRSLPLMASTGAACHDRSVSISHVLSAMGVERDAALGTVRLSMGRWTTEEDVHKAVEAIGRGVMAC